MTVFNNKFNSKNRSDFKINRTYYLTDEQEALFEDFYKNILIDLAKYYFQNKYNISHNNFNELKNELKKERAKYDITDIMLLEEIFEKGKEFYIVLFSKLYVNNLDEINNIFDRIKYFVSESKFLDESPEKYDQIYNLFGLIGSYLVNRLKKENLLVDDLNFDENKHDIDNLNNTTNIKFNKNSEISSINNSLGEEKIYPDWCA